jgi:hypothetical protein
MRRGRLGTVTAVTALLALPPLLSGCGGGQSYCDAVREHQSELGRIVSDGDRTALIQALPAFEDLTDKAPADVSADWRLLVARVKGLETALDDAGVDAASYDPQHPPAGLAVTDRRAIRDAAARLAASDTQQALADVQQEVLDVCHTPLSL